MRTTRESGNNERSSDRESPHSLSSRIQFEDAAELQRLPSLEAAGQGVEFIAGDVHQHLLRNVRSGLKRSHMKGK